MTEQNALDEPKPGPLTLAGASSLNDHLINKKGLAKARGDITKIKGLVSEMQINVVKHGVEIDRSLITEEALKVALELQESEFHHLVNRKLGVMLEAIKPKIKKRVKITEYKGYLTSKVGVEEFNKQIQRIDNLVAIIEDKVDFRLPALEYQFTRDLKKKADKEEVITELGKKVDGDLFEALVARANKMEEKQEEILAQ